MVFHSVYVPHFLYSVSHQWAFRLIPCLCYCEYCCNEQTYACTFVVEGLRSFGYTNPVMGSLSQMLFLVLGLWGVTTLSSTLIELIYITSDSAKVFLFLHSSHPLNFYKGWLFFFVASICVFLICRKYKYPFIYTGPFFCLCYKASIRTFTFLLGFFKNWFYI